MIPDTNNVKIIKIESKWKTQFKKDNKKIK